MAPNFNIWLNKIIIVIIIFFSGKVPITFQYHSLLEFFLNNNCQQYLEISILKLMTCVKCGLTFHTYFDIYCVILPQRHLCDHLTFKLHTFIYITELNIKYVEKNFQVQETGRSFSNGIFFFSITVINFCFHFIKFLTCICVSY